MWEILRQQPRTAVCKLCYWKNEHLHPRCSKNFRAQNRKNLKLRTRYLNGWTQLASPVAMLRKMDRTQNSHHSNCFATHSKKMVTSCVSPCSFAKFDC